MRGGSARRRGRDRTDASIIEESLQRLHAFAEIFDRHFDAIHGYLARRAGTDRADDLAAGTFTVAFERRATLPGLARDAAVAAADPEPSGDGRAAALASALAELDPDQRDILLLHAWQDLRYAEIAAALQIPVGTVRSRLARARSRLRLALEQGADDRGRGRRRRRAAHRLLPQIPLVGVAVAIAVVIAALALLGHRGRSATPATAPSHGPAIVTSSGRSLSSVDRSLADALRREYRNQLRAGLTVRTSLDPTLQRAAERSLHRADVVDGGVHGSVVAMNPETGGIEALSSVRGAISAAGPIGSTFDPITALAALTQRVWSPSETYDDTGSLCVGHGACFHNAGNVAYGSTDVTQALGAEDDIFFEHLALLLGARAPERGMGSPLSRVASRLGIGHRTGVDLPGQTAGSLPEASTPLDAAALAIGDGRLRVSPVQLAVAYAAIANGGTVVVPRVASALVSDRGRVVSTHVSGVRLDLNATALRTVRAGLRANASHGTPVGATAAVFGGLGVRVSGLTGTVQGIDHGREVDNAWYAGYVRARDGHPPLVVVVSVPRGGFGAVTAAPVARQVLSQWETGSPGPWRAGDSLAQ